MISFSRAARAFSASAMSGRFATRLPALARRSAERTALARPRRTARGTERGYTFVDLIVVTTIR